MHALSLARGAFGATKRPVRMKASMAVLATVAALGATVGLPAAPALAVMACFALLLLMDLLRALDFDGHLVAVVLTGVAMYAGYWSYTPYFARGYDAGDQVMYVFFIEHKLRLPSVGDCTICHHPPLYYLVAALWVRLCRLTHFASYEGYLQALSLVLWLGFVVFALFIVRRFARDRATSALAAALIVFWPYAIMSSVRVHNDILVIALTTAALYFTVRWYDDDRQSAFVWATLLSGLSLLTKSSGIIAAVSLLVLLACRLHQRELRARTLRQGVGALVFFGACAWLSVLNKMESGPVSLCGAVLGRACRALRVPSQLARNGPLNYLYFDLRSFLYEPFIDTLRPETGPDYFWNSLLKSSLFGTYTGSPDTLFTRPPNPILAIALNGLLLAMTAYVLFGAIRLTRHHLHRYRVLIMFSVVSLVFSAGFRAAVPLAHHADFRHVLWLLVPGCLFFALTARQFGQKSRALGGIGLGSGILFVLLTIALFLPKSVGLVLP
jgi:hypothetical protein